MAKKKNTFALLGTASVMGLHMVSGPVTGAGLGWLIDDFLNSSPYGIIVGIFLGIIAGYMNVMKDSQRLQKEQEIYNNSEELEEVEEKSSHDHIEYSIFGEEKKINFEEKNSENKEI